MMEKIDGLRVFLYHQPIGTLSRLPGDKYLFSFDQDYIENPMRPTLSLSFKDIFGDLITDIKMTRARLPPFFSNLLPEGLLRDYLAHRAHLNPKHEFYFLWMLGKDLPGALTIRAIEGDEIPFQFHITSLKNEATKEIPLRFSLAGIQLKFSALQKNEHGLVIPANGVGGQWIVKLPHSVFAGVPENEYSMMELARRIGVDVPETFLIPIEEIQGLPKDLGRMSNKVFAIKRFDRTEGGEKIHIEDFAQVFGVFPEKKYTNASYRNIADVIWKEIGEAGIVEFIKRFVFNALIGNGDMHLKNWSLLYRGKNTPSLAPAYDFVSTILYLPEDKLALNFVDSKEFSSLTLDQFKRFASKTQLPEKLVLNTVQETVQAFSEAWKTIKDLPLEEEVRKAILTHLDTIPLWKKS